MLFISVEGPYPKMTEYAVITIHSRLVQNGQQEVLQWSLGICEVHGRGNSHFTVFGKYFFESTVWIPELVESRFQRFIGIYRSTQRWAEMHSTRLHHSPRHFWRASSGEIFILPNSEEIFWWVMLGEGVAKYSGNREKTTGYRSNLSACQILP